MLASLVSAARRAGRRPLRGDRRRSRRSTCTPRAPTPLGGRIVDVPPVQDFVFPLQRVTRGDRRRGRGSSSSPIRTIRPACRSRASSIAAVAAAAPQALVFLDEAYADFSGQTMIEDAATGRDSEPRRRPDVRQGLRPGRTARRRAGRLRRDAGADSPGGASLTRSTPAPRRRFRRRSTTASTTSGISRRSASRSGCSTTRSRGAGVRFWPSDGNFVLACFGDDLARVVAGLAERGINIRDRSRDPGCAGCVRITAGVVEHTRRLRRGARGGPVRRAVIDRQDDRDADLADA